MDMRPILPGEPMKWRDKVRAPVARKVGILGGHPGSLKVAPWEDPTWEWWAHASVVRLLDRKPDRLFELHPKHCFKEKQKHGHIDYYGFLKRTRIPVYMDHVYEEIPASVRYPKEQILNTYQGVPFGSMTAYMIALALYEGVREIGLWGVAYAHRSEYEEQRANAEYWVGFARGLGVRVVLPKETPLCHEPRELYAYESHSTPEKWQARKDKFAKMKAEDNPTGRVFQPEKLVLSVDEAEARANRRKNAAWRHEDDTGAFGVPIPDHILNKEEFEWLMAPAREVEV